MIASIVAAFYVAGILATVHAVMTTRTAPWAIAWSVSLVSTELTRGNEAELLINGDATFDSILAGVAEPRG